jgi:uncharacterized protein with HEPN domain
MRNFVIHDYSNVNPEVIWLTVHIASLEQEKQLQTILNGENIKKLRCTR